MKTIWMMFLLIANATVHSQVILSADGRGDAYALIRSKGFGEEVPDCADHVKHITEILDKDLGKNVFVFTLHKEADNDRCKKFDRQRCEIKTWGPSPDNMKATKGETQTYRWKFKLDATFQPSPGFCHIHQIKAENGDDGAPIMTLTPRGGHSELMQIIHTGSHGKPDVVAKTDLAPFKGAWVEAHERIKYGEHGTYRIEIKRLGDGKQLLAWSSDDLDLWRDGADFIRPKFGIYRKLKKEYLRDESVRFDDFCIAEGATECPEIR